MARDCKTCKHSLFKEEWGEYRCKELQATVKDIKSAPRFCGSYSKDKEKTRDLRTP